MRLEYPTNMKQILATLTIFSVVGCGSDLAQQGVSIDSFPVINPDDPASIAKWESSPYNFANAKISVVQLRFFHGFLGDSTPKEVKSVALQLYDAKTNDINPEQQSAIDGFIQDEAAIHSAIRHAIYEYYKESYSAYKEGVSLGAAMFGGADEIKDILPEISSGNELDDLVQFGTIYIHPPVSGSASIGIDFVVPWDEEHGIGLRLQEGQVEAIGTGHEAFPVPQR